MIYSDIGLITNKDTRYGNFRNEFQTKVSKDNILIDLNSELKHESNSLQARVVYDTNDFFTEFSAAQNLSHNSALIAKFSWLGYPCLGLGLAAKVENKNLDAKTLFTISTNSIKKQDFELKFKKENLIFYEKIEIASQKNLSLVRFSQKIEKNENAVFCSIDSRKNFYVLFSKKFSDVRLGVSLTKMYQQKIDLGLKCELDL